MYNLYNLCLAMYIILWSSYEYVIISGAGVLVINGILWWQRAGEGGGGVKMWWYNYVNAPILVYLPFCLRSDASSRDHTVYWPLTTLRYNPCSNPIGFPVSLTAGHIVIGTVIIFQPRPAIESRHDWFPVNGSMTYASQFTVYIWNTNIFKSPFMEFVVINWKLGITGGTIHSRLWITSSFSKGY